MLTCLLAVILHPVNGIYDWFTGARGPKHANYCSASVSKFVSSGTSANSHNETGNQQSTAHDHKERKYCTVTNSHVQQKTSAKQITTRPTDGPLAPSMQQRLYHPWVNRRESRYHSICTMQTQHARCWLARMLAHRLVERASILPLHADRRQPSVCNRGKLMNTK